MWWDCVYWHGLTGVRIFFIFYFIIIFLTFYLFLRQRETEHEWGRGRERGRHRIGSRLQALSHQPRAQRGAWTHGPRDLDLSWSQTFNRLSHPGSPMFIYFWERERQSMSKGRTEKEGDRIGSRLQALSCQHRARHGARTHELWDHDLSWSWPPGAPMSKMFLNKQKTKTKAHAVSDSRENWFESWLFLQAV